MTKIKCVSPYSAGALVFAVDEVREVEPELAAFLLRDSPGSFEIVKPKRRRRKVVNRAIDPESVEQK